MKKFVLLDLDGTLTDPAPGIRKAAALGLAHFGIEETNEHYLNRFIGPPLRETYCEQYGLTPAQAEEATAVYRSYYDGEGLFENTPYPGIHDLLRAVRATGRKTILATCKPEELAKRIVHRFQLDSLLDVVAGASLDASAAQKKDVVKRALSLCGNPPPSDCIMVGDRKYDVEGAAANGIDTVGVLYGYGCYEELLAAGAQFLVPDTAKLQALLCSL